MSGLGWRIWTSSEWDTFPTEGRSIEETYQALTVEDVQKAADLFRTLYDRSEGRHGFVSLEVNPHLAQRLPQPPGLFYSSLRIVAIEVLYKF